MRRPVSVRHATVAITRASSQSGIEVSLADLPDLIKSYVSSLSAAPESWSSLGPLLGGIKSSTSNLKYAGSVCGDFLLTFQVGQRSRTQVIARVVLHFIVRNQGGGSCSVKGRGCCCWIVKAETDQAEASACCAHRRIIYRPCHPHQHLQGGLLVRVPQTGREPADRAAIEGGTSGVDEGRCIHPFSARAEWLLAYR